MFGTIWKFPPFEYKNSNFQRARFWGSKGISFFTFKIIRKYCTIHHIFWFHVLIGWVVPVNNLKSIKTKIRLDMWWAQTKIPFQKSLKSPWFKTRLDSNHRPTNRKYIPAFYSLLTYLLLSFWAVVEDTLISFRVLLTWKLQKKVKWY